MARETPQRRRRQTPPPPSDRVTFEEEQGVALDLRGREYPEFGEQKAPDGFGIIAIALEIIEQVRTVLLEESFVPALERRRKFGSQHDARRV